MKPLHSLAIRILIFVLAGIASTISLRAQSMDLFVISSAGDNFSNSHYQLNFTVGEPVAESFEHSLQLNQGFHQEWLMTTAVDEEATAHWQVRVFPNPTPAILHVETQTPLMARLMDANGKTMLVNQLDEGTNSMDLNQVPTGIYFLMLAEKDKPEIKSFKIVKMQ